MKELVKEEISLEYGYDAPADRVYSALTAEIGKWWSQRIRDSSTVAFEPRIGGRFYEEWGTGAALYATITYFDPPRRLVMAGPMGMEGANASTISYSLEAGPKGSRLALSHQILGFIEAGVVGDYRRGWVELLGTALPAYLAASPAREKSI